MSVLAPVVRLGVYRVIARSGFDLGLPERGDDTGSIDPVTQQDHIGLIHMPDISGFEGEPYPRKVAQPFLIQASQGLAPGDELVQMGKLGKPYCRVKFG